MITRFEQALIDALKDLSPEGIAQVADFLDFLKARDDTRAVVQAAGTLCEYSLRKLWDNADAADYDRL